MNTRLTSNKDAVVFEGVYWIPIAQQLPPRGAKVLLIRKYSGVAVLSQWDGNGHWTHWAGLPRFKENEDGNDT